MLVLSRRTGERFHIGDHITITVVRIGPNNVRIGISAPKDMPIIREELKDRPQCQRSLETFQNGQDTE